MRRAWIGLALLSASWLFGLSYYRDANWVLWTVLTVAGTVLLADLDRRRFHRGELILAAGLAVPAVVLMPWPYRAAVALVLMGVLFCLAPIPRRWPARLGMAGVISGIILIVQTPAVLAYESVTARSHELPHVLAYVPYAIARLLGIDAALDGTTVALHSMRCVHSLGATWELLLDPATLCFLVGGIVLGALRAYGLGAERRFPIPWVILACVALWLPARVSLLIGAFMHRALRTGYDAPLVLMNQFWSPWVHLILLAGPVLLAMRFVRLPGARIADEPPAARMMSQQ